MHAVLVVKLSGHVFCALLHLHSVEKLGDGDECGAENGMLLAVCR